uniref:Uncharacterized protein LOC104215932 n=1 Tax=Nicotiana sylvestris TaxID=4096 RepID=A0A1U7VCR7_NICSY|nr:PREDICTED: uncharacterized protein LOC104215932 [Nicotiana sylvestris]
MPKVEKEAACTSPKVHDLWVLYTDGASNTSRLGLELVLEVLTSEVIRQSIRCLDMTNNEVEYEAVIARLKLALKYRAKGVVLRCDSQLIVNQAIGTFQIKEQRLQKYQAKICKLLPEFDECWFDQIPRAQNIETDGLYKLVVTTKNITGKGNAVTLLHLSIDQIEDRVLLDDKKEAKKFRMQAVEAGEFAQIREQEVITFIRINIMCCFGLPKEISYDNGPQFTGKKIIEFFEKWDIKRILSMPYHLTGNGQAKSSNKSMLNIMKKKLENIKGLWPELLPEVLWSYCTTPKTSTGETPYTLVYGTDAVIALESDNQV